MSFPIILSLARARHGKVRYSTVTFRISTSGFGIRSLSFYNQNVSVSLYGVITDVIFDIFSSPAQR